MTKTKKQQVVFKTIYKVDKTPFAILDGIKKRFSEVLKDPKAIAAAILVPALKDLWTEDKDILEIGW